MSDSTMTERKTVTVLKWAWRHSHLDADEFDDLDDAVGAAYWGSEYGEEALDCIEVIYDDGTTEVYDDKAVEALMEPRRKAEDEKYEARPKATHVIDIKSPDGRWTAHENANSEADAEVKAERLRGFLGSDRVTIRKLTVPL